MKMNTFFETRFLKRLMLFGFITLLTPCSIVVASGAAPQLPSKASGQITKPNIAANTAKANCSITSIDAATGIVTAKVNSSGQTFQFKVSDTSLFNSLRVGQAFFANFKTNQVSLDGKNIAGTILTASPVDGFRGGVKPVGPVDGAKPAGPVDGAKFSAGTPAACCVITGIDAATGLVTAKVNSTGQSFQFKASGAAPLDSLTVGQAFFANFKTNQVSFDNKTTIGSIIAIGPVDGFRGDVKPVGPVDGAKPVGPVDGVKFGSAGTPAACCVITGIDGATGLVTAKVDATGQSFQFKVSDAALFHSLAVGQAFFANFKTSQVSLDGAHPAGNILNILPAAGTKPTGFSQESPSPAAPTNTPGGSPPKAAAAPPGSGGQPLGAMVAGSAIARPTVAGSQNPGASTIAQATRAVLQITGLVCSTKTDHLGAPVAQGVMIPSGATIYCRFTPPAPPPNGSPAQTVTVSTNVPSVATAPTAVTLLGTYVDFQVTTTPIPQTVPLTVTAAYSGTSTSTTVTLARAAIRSFSCTSWCRNPVTFYDFWGTDYAAGPFPLTPTLSLELTAPADPDGFNAQITADNGSSWQIHVPGGARRLDGFSFALQPVTTETPITYSIGDPFDGSILTAPAMLEPPQVSGLIFLTSSLSISNVPLDGIQLPVRTFILGDPPVGGLAFRVQYGGATNIISGPSTIQLTSAAFCDDYGDGTPPNYLVEFAVTVLPCGVPPCQVSVTVGNNTAASATAALTVNP